MLEHCSAAQRLKILHALQPQQFMKVSQDSRGTHTIQKFIALAATHAEEDILVAGVTGNVV